MKKISERALALASDEAKAKDQSWFNLETRHVARAVDEWQATVEERLGAIEALVGGEDISGDTFEQARKRIRRGARVTDHRFKITDPGPSKYDREPFEEEA